ncbi:hypothetical protein UCDDS831_g00178 [Diplodia seriata]|uniref:Uncharacterized protein n=1 Tax=Diplodia seriata TaxID=420778 RepID=A0A0G2F1W8_9PEZI|nr:hypothetical protein UCDDS831_g00178 [Diplodia seriata]
MSQRIVTKIQLLNHHDKPRPRYSSEVNAVVQVHASLRNKMLPPGPLDGSAELIYMTNIARSNAPGQSPDREKDTDELMFMLEHRPDTIRFWIDERPVGHPSVSKEIRRGVLDDTRNCSVIKVCLNGGREGRRPADGPSPPKESDIYLPPSTRAARVTTTGRADPDPTPSKYRERMGSGSAEDDDSEPEDFKNDVLHDISRLMTHADPFGRFHSSFPETDDSEEEEGRDRFAASPLGGLPRLGQAQLGKFYKAGRRAQSSIFFEEEEALSGQRRIEVSHVEKPEAKRDFAKPSRIRKLGMTLTGGWLKWANQK